MAWSWELFHCKHHVISSQTSDSLEKEKYQMMRILMGKASRRISYMVPQTLLQLVSRSASVDRQNNLGFPSQEGKCFSMASYNAWSFPAQFWLPRISTAFMWLESIHYLHSCFTFPKRRYISRQNVRNGEDFAVIYKFKFASEILYRSRKGRELGRRETLL